MKRNTKIYLRSFYLSLVIIFCLLLGWIGISTAYKNTLRLGWGQEKKAIEITDDYIRILDFTIEI